MASKKENNFWLDLLYKILKEVSKSFGIKSSKSKVQHVVPHEEGWAVKGEGNERFTGVYEDQDDAIRRAREIAINYQSSVVIHRRDGTIRDRRSYKNEK